MEIRKDLLILNLHLKDLSAIPLINGVYTMITLKISTSKKKQQKKKLKERGLGKIAKMKKRMEFFLMDMQKICITRMESYVKLWLSRSVWQIKIHLMIYHKTLNIGKMLVMN